MKNKVNIKIILPVIFMFITQLLALLLVFRIRSIGIGGQLEGDPNSIQTNPLFLLIPVTLGTILALTLSKMRKAKVYKFLIFIVVGMMSFIFFSFFLPLIGSIMGSIILILLLYKYPEWYIVDTAAVILGGTASAWLGITFSSHGYWPIIGVLVFLAIYDAISVYISKHMISLAKSGIKMKLPILMVFPRKKGHSYAEEEVNVKERGENPSFGFLGLGDIIFPSILMVYAAYKMSYLVSFGVMAGSIIGLTVLLSNLMSDRIHAGLPLINGGAIIGFLLNSLLAGFITI